MGLFHERYSRPRMTSLQIRLDWSTCSTGLLSESRLSHCPSPALLCHVCLSRCTLLAPSVALPVARTTVPVVLSVASAVCRAVCRGSLSRCPLAWVHVWCHCCIEGGGMWARGAVQRISSGREKKRMLCVGVRACARAGVCAWAGVRMWGCVGAFRASLLRRRRYEAMEGVARVSH
jgi:hypothetical protein